MSKRNSDGDILTNRLSLGLAKRQKLLASWMGPPTDSNPSNSAPRDDQDEEDLKQDFFGHDRLGVGGILPKEVEDGSFTRRAPTSSDKLLEQLIGKKKAKAHIASKQQAARPGTQQQRHGRPTAVQKEESEDEEEGRAAAFKSKRQKSSNPAKHDPSEDEDVSTTKTPSQTAEDDQNKEEITIAPPVQMLDVDDKEPMPKPNSIPNRSKAKPTSYLDELLAGKSKKKKKKDKSKAHAKV